MQQTISRLSFKRITCKLYYSEYDWCMLNVPSRVLDHFGLPREGWSSPVNTGIVARTLVSEDWVLQSRPIQLLGRMVLLYDIANQAQMPGLKFSGDLLVEQKDGTICPARDTEGGCCVWSLQPKLHEVERLYYPGIDSVQLLQNSQKVLQPVLQQLEVFAERIDACDLICLNNTPGVTIQHSGTNVLKQLSGRKCPLSINPVDKLPDYEPQSNVVSSHGDPILKNTLMAEEGIFLIDWEAVSHLPRHMDFAHFTTFVCKYTDPVFWHHVLQAHWEQMAVYLPDWSYEEWQLAVAWYMVRELSVFPPQNAKRHLGCWEGLDRLIDSI